MQTSNKASIKWAFYAQTLPQTHLKMQTLETAKPHITVNSKVKQHWQLHMKHIGIGFEQNQ